MTDLTEQYREKISASIETALTDAKLAERVKKMLDGLYDDLHSHVEWNIKSDLAYNLACEAIQLADKIIHLLLEGNAEYAARAFQLTGWTGRDFDAFRPLFGFHEVEPIALRRQIVEAHTDLLKTARIDDLTAMLGKARETIEYWQAKSGAVQGQARRADLYQRVLQDIADGYPQECIKLLLASVEIFPKATEANSGEEDKDTGAQDHPQA